MAHCFLLRRVIPVKLLMAVIAIDIGNNTLCTDDSKNLPDAVVIGQNIPEAVIATDEDISRMIQDRISNLIRTQTNQQMDRAQHEIRATSSKEVSRLNSTVEKIRNEIKTTVVATVAAESKEQINTLLRNNQEMEKLINDHIQEVEDKVDQKCREVLDKLVEEGEYRMIDDALRRSLERKIETRIKNGIVSILLANGVIIGGLVLYQVMHKK